MVSYIPYKVLSLSDRVVWDVTNPETSQTKIEEVELIFSCGDLPYYYLENIFELYEAPLFYVRGNHDSPIEYGIKGQRIEPLGGANLHHKVVNFNNLIIAGFEGSFRYREGPYMYTQLEMWGLVLSIVPRLLFNKLIYGRYLDVLVTHAPPWGIHDKEDHVHQGFKAFRWLLKTFQPGYHFHGHIHLYGNDEKSETIYKSTRVINTYGYKETIVRPGKKHIQEDTPRDYSQVSLNSAAEDFRHARRKAAIQTILGEITGKSANLLPFDKVREQLGMEAIYQRGLQNIPLDAIVGSVGRYEDFTRAFFPRYDSDVERWSRVRAAMSRFEKIPPIDVYKIGEAYFVLDGNHRVSVARENGDTVIPAYVTEIETRVPLSPNDQPDDLIIKSQLVKFLEDTHLDELRPDLDFSTTYAGSYRQLREQIAVHHFLMDMKQQWPMDYQDAVLDWADNVYSPILEVIQSLGLLRDFPGRTPTDLYLWIVAHQKQLADDIGWRVSSQRVAEDLVKKYSSNPIMVVKRIKEKIKSRLIPKTFDSGPSPGEWRKIHVFPRQEGKLFSSILAAVSNSDRDWIALKQAILIAQREEGSIRGITVVSKEENVSNENVLSLRTRFEKLCHDGGVVGEWIMDTGKVAETIIKRAQWSDLVVFKLKHPPKNKTIERLRSGLRTLIQASQRPLLAVPAYSPMKRALLAYDGSEKADEALFLGTYIAKNWGTELIVVTAKSLGVIHAEPISRARKYLLSRDVDAEFVQKSGEAGQVILDLAEERNCDFIIMGGYGYKPVLEMVLGSTVDQVLRHYKKPVLICR
jgi:nucleotide-binding universal stress UspA family protein/Icc-related predicted phosphoesterase